MKRILIFSIAYHPFVGGAEVAIKEITDRIGDISFDLLTVNLDGKQALEETIGNIKVYRVGNGTVGKFLFPLFGFLKARKLHKKNPYDAVWSVMANQASVAAAFFKMRNRSVPLVLTLQEGDDESHLARYVGGSEFLYTLFIKPWHTFAIKKANFITAISDYLKNRARKYNRVAPLEIIPNGVNYPLFSKPVPEEELIFLKERLGKKEKDIYLITTSRLVAKNAVGDVIKALSYLPDQISFLILGLGDKREELKNLVEQEKVSDRVTFLGQVSHTEIPKYLKISDVFIRPSISEGFGNSFIEAMAAGIPVIATPVGGIVDFLKDRHNGLFAEVGNPGSIAEAVLEYLNNPELRETVVENGFQTAERYDWKKIAENMRWNVFDKVIPR